MPTKKSAKKTRSRAFGEPAERLDRERQRREEAWDRENAKSFSVTAPGRVAHALAAAAKRERRSVEDQILIMLRDSLENELGISLDDYGEPRDISGTLDD
jgi:hypothetical protein